MEFIACSITPTPFLLQSCMDVGVWYPSGSQDVDVVICVGILLKGGTIHMEVRPSVNKAA
eukprot:735919-Amphidinium_carterae.1